MSEKAYFNLHTHGIAYLNRAREVRPRKGEPFWAVEVNALYGHPDDVDYTRIDCRVTGREAQEVVERLEQAINDRSEKVLARFKIGDIYPEAFVYRSGQRAGEYGVTIKGRLLRLEWVKVNGETVHTAAIPHPAADREQHAPHDGAEPAEPSSEEGGIRSTSNEGEREDALGPAESPAGDQARGQGADSSGGDVIQLSKDDPHFQTKKERLKKAGYRFDPKERVWRKPVAEPAPA
ncbi:MAG: DUF3577 domain-containing protein [Halorhodospira halophila]|uniref:DUF3577 domain-containing protein n=1 Tax=Halorhodospira TaxID=85108 RepID=UPI001EE99E8D|nr:MULTISPECIES: DUF3577 domain-containing protein [Halorhodospira]MCC3750840.1 DUF3577 domain-containing protein [Halorhodospira halophila]MCG5537334.1 DUF3577 domain-containing protein [Halorhodospira sp. 9622]